jgi:nucleoside phosphorylase
MPQIDVLVLVAHRLELSGFDGALDVTSDTGAKANDRMLHGVRIAAAEVGVGMPAAGSGTARALARVRPRAALLLGSFGAYPGPGSLPIGKLLVPSACHAVELSVLHAHAAMPDAMAQSAECDVALSNALAPRAANVARGVLATTLGITTDDALASELGERSGCCAENLEALAVALACSGAAVPFAALLACTNQVGARGRAQWAAEHANAARATASTVLAWLARGAPGLPPR